MKVIVNSDNVIVDVSNYVDITSNVQKWLDDNGYRILDIENPIKSKTKGEFNEDIIEFREFTEEDKQAEFRSIRNSLLSEADILINKAEDNGVDSTELRKYRQALRDATNTWELPSL